jgi:gliding motility-associated lipoprotein GldD
VKKLEIIFILFFLLGLLACENIQVPKEKGYPRIELPNHTYSVYQKSGCRYTFEYPSFGQIGYHDPDSCWMDIYYPQFNCNWHITFRDLNKEGHSRNEEFEEYRRLIYKHTIKASEIRETPVKTNHTKGIFFEMYGNVPTSAQLFLTDPAEKYSMEVAFYFFTSMKNDSLAPVIDFMKEDLLHLVETIRFEEE